MNWKAVVEELRWFLSGSTNVHDLQAHGVHIWDEWADADGSLGPTYGAQLRGRNAPDWFSSAAPDQVMDVIRSLCGDPTSRRHIISTWNPSEFPYMRLPPCHGLVIQFYVHLSGRLDMSMYQRSADIFLGVPFNIASYALLLHLMARWTGHEVGTMHMTLGDVHLYSNHVDQAREQLTREPYGLPEIAIDERCDTLDGFLAAGMESTALLNYEHHSTIKAPVAV